jgi:hypothetical protein
VVDKELTEQEKAEFVADILTGKRTWCSECDHWHNNDQYIICIMGLGTRTLVKNVEIDAYSKDADHKQTSALGIEALSEVFKNDK